MSGVNKIHLILNNSASNGNNIRLKVYKDYQTAVEEAEKINKKRGIISRIVGLKYFVKTFSIQDA
jgi:hypothetical protein